MDPGTKVERILASTRVALAAAALLGPGLEPARAHEAHHEIERGKAIAVKASLAGGEALANAAYQVYSPADPEAPWQEGRTDRRGWLAFVPDAPGRWRVKVFDAAGHGLDLRVDAALPPGPAAPAAGGGSPSGLASVLRLLAGLAVVGGAVAALVLAYRRKEPARR